MKVTKIYLGAILILIFSICYSCNENRLDIPPTIPTESEYFSSDEEFEAAVFGIYQKLQNLYTYKGINFLHGIWLLPDDNLTVSDVSGDRPFDDFVALNSTNSKISVFYGNLYELVSRANVVLQKIETNGESYKSQLKRDHNKGEALMLRGYANFVLWNMFGTSPLILDRIENVEEANATTNSNGNELLDQAIDDFKEAASLLPPSWDNLNTGRVTSGSANGMLAKALIFRAGIAGSGAAEDYRVALATINKLSGYELLKDFGDNFDEKKENSIESLFEVQFSNNPATNNVWLSNDDFVNGDLGGYWGFFSNDPNLFGRPVYEATSNLKKAYAKADPRLKETIDSATLAVRKYVSRGDLSGGNPDNYNNARILRYSDVLLLKAEATVGSGGSLADAVDLVNIVRTRARNSTEPAAVEPANYNNTESDPAVVHEWIIQERRLELAFEEGHRWYDLRRMHLAGKIDLRMHDFGSKGEPSEFEEHNLYFPIPAGEVEQTDVRQNPGYQ